MQSVLGTPAAEAARGDEPTDEVVEQEVEEEALPPDEEEAEDEESAEDEAPDDEDEVVEEPSADDQEEADDEADALHRGDGAYAGYDTVEELIAAYEQRDRDYRETRAWGQDQSRNRAALEREMAEVREMLAYQSGRVESGQGEMAPPESEQFAEWAEEQVEDNPERGMAEVTAYGEETGDWSYAVAFTDVWGESDPYQAAIARNYVNMAIAIGRGGQPQVPDQTGVSGQGYDREHSANVISAAYATLRDHYPDLAEGSPVLGGVVEVIRSDQRLHSMTRSGDLDDVTWAIEMARERYLASQPRRTRPRASRADREALAAEKAATRMPQGSGRPNGRTASSNGAVPADFQDAMEVFGRWGMVRQSDE